MHDVIVVGGGPVGSYTAGKLSAAGHNVLVIERKPAPGGPVCCTGIIGQECVEIFDVPDSVILRRVNSARIFPPSAEPLYLRRNETQACILDRPAFDTALAVRAQEQGAEYIFDCAASEISIEAGKARVTAARNSRETNFHSRAVIIASGFGRGLTSRAGMGRAGDFTVGAQAEVAAPGLEEVEVYFGSGIAPGFFSWLVPVKDGVARAGLMARKNAAAYLKSWLGRLKADGKISSVISGGLYGGIPLRPLKTTSSDRLLVVGDAAGQVKPTSGGGIYYGMLCADIAADVLHRALAEDDLSGRSLSRYHKRWRRKLGRELRIGYWGRKLFERLSDRQIDRIFKIMKTSGTDQAMLGSADLSFDWHSRTLLSLIKHRMISGAIGLVKLPFRSD